MVVAIQHIDPWSKQAAIQLFTRGKKEKRALDLGVALVVSLLSITVNIVLAVFIGLAIAVLLFVLRMSRSNVRRLYRCTTMRSRRVRAAEEMKSLEANGASILVLELQGALFFGSAEHLAQLIEAETAHATSALILDLRRVTEIDSTGVRILTEINGDLARRGIALRLVVHIGSEAGESLAALPGHRLPDLDRALEQAENELLKSVAHAGDAPIELPLEQVSLLREFTPDQLDRLRPYLERREFTAGSTIFHAGAPGSHLFLVTRGRASVHLVTGDRDIRLVTFTPGTVFGELAILDHGLRSATVTADDALTVFALSQDGFTSLQSSEPDVAIKILSALGRELSSRLRQANMTIHQLEG